MRNFFTCVIREHSFVFSDGLLHSCVLEIFIFICVARSLPFELFRDVHYHFVRSHANTLHAESSKPVWQHRSKEKEGKCDGAQNVDVECYSRGGMTCDTRHKPSEKGKRHEGSRSDGKAFADGSSGVASSIQGISLVTYKFGELGHLGETSSIVSDRTVDVDGKASGKRTQHAKSCECNTVHPTEKECNIDVDGKEGNGNDAGQVAKREAIDNVGSSTR